VCRLSASHKENSILSTRSLYRESPFHNKVLDNRFHCLWYHHWCSPVPPSNVMSIRHYSRITPSPFKMEHCMHHIELIRIISPVLHNQHTDSPLLQMIITTELFLFGLNDFLGIWALQRGFPACRLVDFQGGWESSKQWTASSRRLAPRERSHKWAYTAIKPLALILKDDNDMQREEHHATWRVNHILCICLPHYSSPLEEVRTEHGVSFDS